MFKKGFYFFVVTVTFIILMLFINSCKKEGDDITSVLPSEVDVTGTWYGTYSSSVVFPTQLTLVLTQNGSTVTGTYSSQSGGYGTVSGNVEGNNIANFVMTLANPECQGSFNGTAVVTGDTINFDFTGHDCFGTHTNGHGMVMRNTLLPASDSLYIKIKLLNIPQTLTFNQSHVNTYYIEYKWGILFDTDNNDTTGLIGFDTEISIGHAKQNAASFQASIINGTESQVIEWEKDSIHYYSGYTKHSNFSVRLNPSDKNELIMVVPRTWTEIARINENTKFYIYTDYIPPDHSYCHDQTVVSSGTLLISDPASDVSYDFVDIVSGGWNTHSLMKKYSQVNHGTNKNSVKIKEQYWSGNKWILKHE